MGIIIEVRAAEGGDDAKLLVDEQLGIYTRLAAQQQLTLEVDCSAKQLIAKEGFDPQFGVRPAEAGHPGPPAGPASHEAPRWGVQTR